MMRGISWERKSFIYISIVSVFVSMIWYRKILFRCIEGRTLLESKCFLWGIMVLAIIGNYYFSFWLQEKASYNAADTIFPFGLYTVFAYWHICWRLILVLFCTAAILSIIYMFFIMQRKIRRRKNIKRLICKRIKRALEGTKRIFNIAMAVIMIILCAGLIWRFPSKQAVRTIAGDMTNENTISGNIESLLLLQDEEWSQLSIKEKLDLCQIIGNIESRYLGLPHEVTVRAANLDENTLGHYNDRTHEITINLDCLLYDDASKVLDVIAHESRHAYQHRLVDVFNDARFKNLMLFNEIAVYKKEFEHYESANKGNFSDYYGQQCEQDARAYGCAAVDDYFEHIYEYLDDQ